ncbi:MAG: type VI secretion system tip protein TssI/VgrG [bacterium]
MSRQVDKLFLNLSGPEATDLICVGARLRDQLSMLPEMRMEIYSKSTSFDPTSILGTPLTLEAENGFKFSGICISVEDLGHQDSIDLFAVELRPWPWLLTLGSENRVFQGLKTGEIIEKVFRDAEFTDFVNKISDAGEPREYCVQYGESNFDFICRLMEEDGYYYFFDHSGSTETFVMADGISAHKNAGKVPFTVSNQVGTKQADSNSIFEWEDVGRVVTGKVSLWDYDMATPNANLQVSAAIPSGSHAYKAMERYQASGHFKQADKGEKQARKEMEGYAAEHQRSAGATNSSIIATGAIFTLAHAGRSAADGDYLVTKTTHYMQFDPGFSQESKQTVNRHVERIDYPADIALYETEFEVQKSSIQYRPPKVTPLPEVPSLLTAKVTGPDGEEIHTDEYGRIKVIFPWDRLGEPKDTSSIWVRSVMPWGGKDWGMFSVPRIGMEVIVQFERGNIDRPYCTGVVYNGVNKPPYALPNEMTKTGIRTNSSKGGGGFHELTFDDKKDSESIFFQSEKDYKQIIKNNAEITIGMEKKDKGSLTQTIYQDKTETIKEGDLTQTVEKGNRITKIKTDDTETIEGKQTVEITGDTALTIKTGNKTEKVSTGNSNIEVSSGNMDTKVAMGNITIDASMGKVTISAMQAIELKVGGNSVKIDMTGITIAGALVTLDAKGMAEVKGSIVMVKGSGMTQVSGGVVMVG